MTTQSVLDNLAAWIESEVTPQVTLKKAVMFGLAEDEGYSFELVHPAVYVTTFPRTAAEHENENDDRPILAPAIIVYASGTSTINTATGATETPITLLVQTWNPGKHDLITNEAGETVPAFRVDAEGWRDLACFVDKIISALAQAELPGGLAISKNISYSLPDVEENNFYPYYRSEVTFTATHYMTLQAKFNI